MWASLSVPMCATSSLNPWSSTRVWGRVWNSLAFCCAPNPVPPSRSLMLRSSTARILKSCNWAHFSITLMLVQWLWRLPICSVASKTCSSGRCFWTCQHRRHSESMSSNGCVNEQVVLYHQLFEFMILLGFVV
jgi:hypothetical protein